MPTVLRRPKSDDTILRLARQATADGYYLAANADGDLVLGKDGAKWRHNWTPLNAVAAAIKAKRWHGHGGEKPKVAAVASSRGGAGKSRIDVERTMRGSGPDRGKARSTKPTGLRQAAERERIKRAMNDQQISSGHTKKTKTDQEKIDTLARKYGRENAYKHPNGRQYFVNPKSPFSGHDAHTGYSIEGQSGEHLGRVSVREGKLHIEHAAHGGTLEDLGDVKTPKEAVHGLVAARYLQDEHDRKKREADAAAAEKIRADNEARKTEAQKAVEAAKAEKIRREEETYRRQMTANRNRLFSPAPKPKPTRTDTPTMQKMRATLAERLGANATDITEGVHPDSLGHGQTVRFRTYEHGVASQNRIGHVVHTGGGVTHIHSLHPETGKSEYFSDFHRGGKYAKVGHRMQNMANEAADKGILIYEHNRPMSAGSIGHQKLPSVGEMMRKAEAETARRLAVKKTKH